MKSNHSTPQLQINNNGFLFNFIYFRLGVQPIYSIINSDNQLKKAISLISLSVDSQHIACCSESDNTLKIYTLGELKLIYKKIYQNPLISLEYSSDGNYLIICSQRGSEILSKFNYQSLFTQENELNIYKSLSISPDSNYFAVLYEFNHQNDCFIIKVDQGFKDIYNLEHISPKMNQVAISNDSQYLALMSDRDQFKIWNKQKNIKSIKQIKCNRKAIYSACFSRDGKYLVTSSSEDICEVWDTQNEYRLIKDIKIHHNQQGLLDESDFSVDEVVVDLFVQNSQRLQSRIELHHNDNNSTVKKSDNDNAYDSNSHIFAVAFSIDDKYLATGSSDKTCKVWNVEKKFELHKTLSGHLSSVSSVSFSPDGCFLVTGSKDNSCRVWSIENEFNLHRIISSCKEDSFPISSVTFSTYGKYLATGSYDNSCKIWDASNDFKLEKKLEGHTSHIYSIAFSDNEKYFASGSSDSTCKVWSVEEDFKLIKSIEFHRSGIYAVAFSKMSKYLATGSYDNTCGIWSVNQQFQLLTIINNIANGIYTLAFSADGEQLITGVQLSNNSVESTIKIQNKLQISTIEDIFENIYTL